MPTYDYGCTNCGHVIEVVHGVNEAGPTVCPECGGLLRKRLSAPAIHFRGTGWAKKDARQAIAARSAKSTSDSSGKSTADSADKEPSSGAAAGSSEGGTKGDRSADGSTKAGSTKREGSGTGDGSKRDRNANASRSARSSAGSDD